MCQVLSPLHLVSRTDLIYNLETLSKYWVISFFSNEFVGSSVRALPADEVETYSVSPFSNAFCAISNASYSFLLTFTNP